jgi:diacylglycerol kinase family enzyme
MRIDVILNTNARLFKTSPKTVDAARRLCAGRADLHATQSVGELDDVCEMIAARGSELVVLCGGDGTFMAGTTALSRAHRGARLPKVALLPGGTVATVARNWGFRGDPTPHLARILSDPSSLKSAPRPTLSVRASLDGDRRDYVGFIFGTGLVARFFEVYEAEGAAGYAGAARIAARIFVESFVDGPLARRVLDPLPCSLFVGDRKLPPDAWSLICAAVVKDLGIHMWVNYRAAERLDRPHLVASPLKPRRLGPRAPLVIAGKCIGGEGYFDDLVDDFTVRFAPEGPFVLDGETLRANEVRVSAGPTLDVMLPAR